MAATGVVRPIVWEAFGAERLEVQVHVQADDDPVNHPAVVQVLRCDEPDR